MNKFIKLPLFLGGVCLVFCSALAIVVNICQPIIDENERINQNRAYATLYENVDVDGIRIYTEEEAQIEGYSRINSLASIPHGLETSYAYTLTTADPQSGTLTFMLGISMETGNIDGYRLITNNNAGYATFFENNDNVFNVIKDYNGSNDFDIGSGATKTKNVVKDAINQALNHYSTVLEGGTNE